MTHPYLTTRQQIITVARSWINTPYRDQASLKGVGCDCLGLLRGVFRELNHTDEDPEQVPAYQSTWYDHSKEDELLNAAKRHLNEIQEIKPGCVLVFRMRITVAAKHCAIVTENDYMLHAYSGKKVFEVSMGEWWKNKVVGIFDFPGVID